MVHNKVLEQVADSNRKYSMSDYLRLLPIKMGLIANSMPKNNHTYKQLTIVNLPLDYTILNDTPGVFIVDLKVTNPNTGKCTWVKALWDTGAQSSCISERVAEELKLPKAGRKTTKVYGATSNSNHSRRYVDITLHNTVFKKVSALCLGDGYAVDALIGMDIISTGELFIFSAQGKHILNFKIPE